MGASRRRWPWTQALKDKKEFVVLIGHKEGLVKEGQDHRRREGERNTCRSPGLCPEPGGPGRARRALDPAHFGERTRAAPQFPRLCWIQCLRQAAGGLPETHRQRVWPLRPDSAWPNTAARSWFTGRIAQGGSGYAGQASGFDCRLEQGAGIRGLSSRPPSPQLSRP